MIQTLLRCSEPLGLPKNLTGWDIFQYLNDNRIHFGTPAYVMNIFGSWSYLHFLTFVL